MLGNRNDSLLIEDHQLGQHAIARTTKHVLKGVIRLATTKPALNEYASDAIPNFPTRYAVAYSNDLTCTVRRSNDVWAAYWEAVALTGK